MCGRAGARAMLRMQRCSSTFSPPSSSSSASASSSFLLFATLHIGDAVPFRGQRIGIRGVDEPAAACCIAKSPCRSVPLTPSSSLLVSPAPASAATWNSQRAPTGIPINSNAAATLSFALLMAALFLNGGSGSGGQAEMHLIQVRALLIGVTPLSPHYCCWADGWGLDSLSLMVVVEAAACGWHRGLSGLTALRH